MGLAGALPAECTHEVVGAAQMPACSTPSANAIPGGALNYMRIAKSGSTALIASINAARRVAPAACKPVHVHFHDVTADRLAVGAASFAVLREPCERFDSIYDHGKLFDVVGVLERFEDTCRLLDSVIPLPKERRYAKAATRNAIQHGSAKYKAEEKATLAVAKMDTDVRSALAWDLRLYDEVVLSLFERQMLTIQ